LRLAHGAAHLTVVPSVDAVSTAGQDLVGTVRAVPHPGYPAYTTGLSARLVDDEAAIGRGLPWALTIVALATVALVFLLTGSVLIPLQAVLLNALSLTAMLGAVVWVFQDGHLSGLLGFTATGTIETSLPVLMCCVAFGLSMDYGVFLLSRIKEEHDRTGDHEGAIATGVRRTGGVITAAALILAVVLVGIGTSRISNTKMLGLGVALAVLMDAMVVRTLLVPAVLKLTGRAAWWAPGPLRRLHTRVGLREETEAPREYADVR
jgi:RND superfamily putative drug exporter